MAYLLKGFLYGLEAGGFVAGAGVVILATLCLISLAWTVFSLVIGKDGKE